VDRCSNAENGYCLGFGRYPATVAPEPFSEDRVDVSPKWEVRHVKLRHVDFNFRSHDVIGHLFLRWHHHDAAEEQSKLSRREVTG
jgi:hypothetical protein